MKRFAASRTAKKSDAAWITHDPDALLLPNKPFSPTPMLITDTLSPEDSALIEREAGSALKALFAPLVHEPLPDRLAVLLEQLAVQEPRHGRDDSGVRS